MESREKFDNFEKNKIEILGKEFCLDDLIPESAREIATNPNNLEVMLLGSSEKEISIAVVEHYCEEELTNKESWDDWNKKIIEAKESDDDEISLIPKSPTEVNRMHAKLRGEVESGRINFSDRILMSVRLRFLPENETLYVGDYDGEIGMGIATDFYQNKLPEFARKKGFKFLTGLNNDKNISFFTEKLGRYPLSEINEDGRKFFDGVAPENDKSFTIQFLREEDIEKYIIKKEKDKE